LGKFKSSKKISGTLEIFDDSEIEISILETFEQTETVQGNGWEIKILNWYKFTNGNSLTFVGKNIYCTINLEVKNIDSSKYSFGPADLTFTKQDLIVIIYPDTFYIDRENLDKFPPKKL
jgi:hypothetical protein